MAPCPLSMAFISGLAGGGGVRKGQSMSSVPRIKASLFGYVRPTPHLIFVDIHQDQN